MPNQERLVQDFVQMVRIDSLTKNERAMADHLLKKLTDMGFSPYEDDTASRIGGTSGNVVCRIPGCSSKPALLLMAHMDTVVPGIGKRPVIDGDWIKSDGNTVLGGDDAAGIAIILEAVRSLEEEGARHGDLYLAFTVAEEGGLFGARNLDMSKIPADFAYILDDEGEIATAAVQAPYYNRLKAIFKGRAAHAGMEPEKGLSAILMASRAIAGMPHFGRIDKESTCNIGIIQGGQARNIVTETCSMEGEIRSISEEKLNRFTREIIEAITASAHKDGGSVEVELEHMYPGYHIQEADPVIQILKKASEKEGLPLYLHATGGGSDTNVINGYGIPAVDISVGMEKIHSTDECIRISNMMKACRFLKSVITEAFAYSR